MILSILFLAFIIAGNILLAKSLHNLGMRAIIIAIIVSFIPILGFITALLGYIDYLTDTDS